MIINALLLIVSIAIYASFGIQSLLIIFFSIVTSFFTAKYLHKVKHKKALLVLTLFANVAILVFFKMIPSNFSIIAPLGISYYTLQIVSYLVDVYKGKYEPEQNFFNFTLYITYIPHLLIGPISRYDDMKKTLLQNRKITCENIFNGFLRVCLGLVKKFIISGRTAILISTLTSGETNYVGAYALFAMIVYAIEIYADFSGGIDIVIGLSKMLGIEIKENFDSPYFSESIKEFWRRWHISLSSWLKDYVYIPLGGNRKGTLRKNINLLITFTISGLWHGISYVLWGILNGIFVMFGDKFKTKNKTFNRLCTFLIICFLWSFYIWPNPVTACQMITSVFTNFNYGEFFSNILNLGLNMADWIVLSIFTILLFIYDGNKNKLLPKVQNSKLETRTALIGIMLVAVLVLGVYGIGFNVNSFIYSKF